MIRRALLPLAALLLMGAAPGEAEPDGPTEHVVQPGETLMGIANRTQVPRVLIAEANGLKPPYALRAGQKLVIPRTRRYTVKGGDSGFAIAMTYGLPWRAIAQANGLDPTAPIRPGQVLLIPTVIAPSATPGEAEAEAAVASADPRFAWPVAGPIRRGFVGRPSRNYHDGLDIRASVGTAVRSVGPGKVLFAGREPRQFGNLVVVDHGGGWHSAYGFLSRITVRKGETVGRGERVGLSGRTGLARGPELHFELRRDNRPVNPLSQLPER